VKQYRVAAHGTYAILHAFIRQLKLIGNYT
jgi:hypothetical protein